MLPALCTGGRHAARGLLGGCRLRKSVGPLVWLGAPPARSCSSAPGLSWATRETLHRVLHKYSRDFRYKEPQPALPSCEELGRLEERIRRAAAWPRSRAPCNPSSQRVRGDSAGRGRCEAPASRRPCSARGVSTGAGRARPARRRYKFRNPWMLRLALLHLSAVQASTAVQLYHEMPVQNQTPATMLPLIGDSVLGLLVVEGLCAAYPTARVGELTRAKHSLCCREACSECAPARTRQGCFKLSGSQRRGGRLRGRARSAAAAGAAARCLRCSCSRRHSRAACVCMSRAGCARLQCQSLRWGGLQRRAQAPWLRVPGRPRLLCGAQAGACPGAPGTRAHWA